MNNVLKVYSIVWLIIPTWAWSQSPADEASTYYEQGAYEEALTVWYEMAASGQSGAGLYYNIGLAESQMGQTAKAMLAFEKALRIKPGNHSIKQSILKEREKIFEAAIPVRPFFLKEWYKQLVMLVRPGVWAILALILFLVLCVRFLLQFRQQPENWVKRLRQIRFWIAGAGILLLLSLLSYHELHRDNEAIIREPCSFYTAPSSDSPQIREIGEGEKVMIMDQIGEWYNVYLVNQDAGWVQGHVLLPIRIDQ